jgi:hypothetical protein
MDMVKRAVVLGICIVASSAAACSSWAPPLPSSPSSLPSVMDSAPSKGVTIQGRVQGAVATAAKLAGPAQTLAALTSTVTLTVKIVGTNISAPVSPSGAFVLEGVPSGNIQLQFVSQSDNAIASLGTVNTGERLDVEIRLAGSVGVIEASMRVKLDNTTEIEGDVAALSGSCPNLTFMVNGWTLKVDPSSQTACSDIKVGVKVKVKGTLTSNRVVITVRVDITGHSEGTESRGGKRGRGGDDDDDEHDDSDHDD